MAAGVVTVASRAAAFYVVWLAIDDNVSQPELFLGIGVALIATAITSLTARALTEHARLRASMLRRLYRPLILLVGDSARVSWVLLKAIARRQPSRGRFRAVRYRATGDDREDVARRLLTQWGASLAPNRYVIGIDTDADVLLVHELGEAHGPLDPLELG
jgi:multisubunit Na+/H+ antiporter MnhE subunit